MSGKAAYSAASQPAPVFNWQNGLQIPPASVQPEQVSMLQRSAVPGPRLQQQLSGCPCVQLSHADLLVQYRRLETDNKALRAQACTRTGCMSRACA